MIGDRIKNKRIELGMTQDELAQLVGYKSRSAVNKIELNLRDISSDKIVEFSKALRTTPLYLLGLEDASSPSASTPDISALFMEEYGKELFDLIDQIRQLDDVDRARIMERIEIMLEDDKYKGAESSSAKAI